MAIGKSKTVYKARNGWSACRKQTAISSARSYAKAASSSKRQEIYWKERAQEARQEVQQLEGENTVLRRMLYVCKRIAQNAINIVGKFVGPRLARKYVWRNIRGTVQHQGVPIDQEFKEELGVLFSHKTTNVDKLEATIAEPLPPLFPVGHWVRNLVKTAEPDVFQKASIRAACT